MTLNRRKDYVCFAVLNSRTSIPRFRNLNLIWNYCFALELNKRIFICYGKSEFKPSKSILNLGLCRWLFVLIDVTKLQTRNSFHLSCDPYFMFPEKFCTVNDKIPTSLFFCWCERMQFSEFHIVTSILDYCASITMTKQSSLVQLS